MSGGGGGDWSEIPEDILVSIANRLVTVIDYLCLGEVCKPWRSITLSPHNLLLPRPPYLMLAASKQKTEGNNEIPRRGFVGLNDNSKVYELHLPELHQNRCIGSTGNWLILVNLQFQVLILNPFTRSQFQFPSQSTLPNQLNEDEQEDDEDKYSIEELRDYFISKAILSSTPESSSVVVIVVFGAKRRLAIARPGDKSWIPIQSHIPIVAGAIHDVIFFKNQFYCINGRGNVSVCDIDCNPPRATQVSGDFKDIGRVDKYYLVEWLGKLLLVTKYIVSIEEDPCYKTQRFEVYMFDFDNGDWLDIKSLGLHSLFVGFNTSLSLLASHSSPFSRNCIYFTDDCRCEIESGRDMGVFDLGNKTIKPHYTGISTSSSSSPLWIIPKSIYK